MGELGGVTELLRPQYGDHLVQFHPDEESAAETIGAYLGSALAEGGVAIAFMADARFPRVCERLAARGHALGPAMRERRLIYTPAEKAVLQVVYDGRLDEIRFKELVRPLLEEALQTAERGRVCVYGEIVGLLTEAGRLDEALELERFWNRLLRRYPFSLYCGYSDRAFQHPGRDGARACVSELHTHVVGS